MGEFWNPLNLENMWQKEDSRGFIGSRGRSAEPHLEQRKGGLPVELAPFPGLPSSPPGEVDEVEESKSDGGGPSEVPSEVPELELLPPKLANIIKRGYGLSINLNPRVIKIN